MPPTKEQIEAARKALIREREQLVIDRSDAALYISRLRSDISLISETSEARENIDLLNSADRQLTTIRHQLTQLRRRVRKVAKRDEQMQNGVFLV